MSTDLGGLAASVAGSSRAIEQLRLSLETRLATPAPPASRVVVAERHTQTHTLTSAAAVGEASAAQTQTSDAERDPLRNGQLRTSVRSAGERGGIGAGAIGGRREVLQENAALPNESADEVSSQWEATPRSGRAEEAASARGSTANQSVSAENTRTMRSQRTALSGDAVGAASDHFARTPRSEKSERSLRSHRSERSHTTGRSEHENDEVPVVRAKPPPNAPAELLGTRPENEARVERPPLERSAPKQQSGKRSGLELGLSDDDTDRSQRSNRSDAPSRRSARDPEAASALSSERSGLRPSQHNRLQKSPYAHTREVEELHSESEADAEADGKRKYSTPQPTPQGRAKSATARSDTSQHSRPDASNRRARNSINSTYADKEDTSQNQPSVSQRDSKRGSSAPRPPSRPRPPVNTEHERDERRNGAVSGRGQLSSDFVDNREPPASQVSRASKESKASSRTTSGAEDAKASRQPFRFGDRTPERSENLRAPERSSTRTPLRSKGRDPQFEILAERSSESDAESAPRGGAREHTSTYRATNERAQGPLAESTPQRERPFVAVAARGSGSNSVPATARQQRSPTNSRASMETRSPVPHADQRQKRERPAASSGDRRVPERVGSGSSAEEEKMSESAAAANARHMEQLTSGTPAGHGTRGPPELRNAKKAASRQLASDDFADGSNGRPESVLNATLMGRSPSGAKTAPAPARANQRAGAQAGHGSPDSHAPASQRAASASRAFALARSPAAGRAREGEGENEDEEDEGALSPRSPRREQRAPGKPAPAAADCARVGLNARGGGVHDLKRVVGEHKHSDSESSEAHSPRYPDRDSLRQTVLTGPASDKVFIALQFLTYSYESITMPC